MDDMATVLRNPARAWLKGQGIRVADLSHELGERCEPIELDGLQRWHLEQRARRGVLLGEDPESILQTLRQDGSLPHGAVSGPMWREVWSTQEEILTRLIEALGVPACTLEIEPLAFELPDLDPALQVRTLWIPSHRTQVLVTRVGREKEWLTVWPEHLAFAAAHPDGRTIRIDLPRNRREASKSIPHEPVDSATALQILRQVREIAEEAQRRLLPIHAELLYPFRVAIDAPSEERSESLRQKLWVAGPGFAAPAEDPWFRAAWRGLDLLKAGRESGAARIAGLEPSFDGIASWLHEAMEQTGWAVRKRKGST
jgi:exonuclease V gamma subunit